MLTLLSPAKTLDYESPLLTQRTTSPDFLQDSAALIDELRQWSVDDIAGLMGLSNKLAELNVERYSRWQLPFPEGGARQAVLAFKGDVYTGLQVEDFSDSDFDFAQQHVRILSGLYGLLRPLDEMLPYRLEMGTRLANVRGKDLYAFWGSRITDAINEVLAQQVNPVVVNLASNEYFKAVQPKRLTARLITPEFRDEKNGQYKIISFYAKKARGLMTRFMVQNRIDHADELKDFDLAGYRYSAEDSKSDKWVFKRAEKDIQDA
ncbi:peroxide stress protein YaaA [Parathalassolituus penaei]|uniref:UPF0246 protein OUO13_00375 n=1 Tax=Parathalassolituus penaei TaxID=2997323 RepID=A0A9X3E9Y4_9GAMM|nr:peroxide stress protein YaaA [Parathalassolituus penaei]MCY0963644.1 peroxide stress protein YaaA [Parathalassolituus penaei]